jgi:hypothetical protein
MRTDLNIIDNKNCSQYQVLWDACGRLLDDAPSATTLPTGVQVNTMTDNYTLDILRIPSQVLIALDWRPFHFALQRFHHLVRLTHIVTMAGFFGAIGLLDLRLLGWGSAIPPQPLARHILPLLYGLFAFTIATGVALFLYDPVKVGSHAYFTPKLFLIALALANAGLFHRAGHGTAPAAVAIPRHARLAGALSLAIWTAVIICACLNVEAEPKVLLR